MRHAPLVTGGTGFAGSHLIEHLLEHDGQVSALSNPRGKPPPLTHPRLQWQALDLLDRDGIARAISELRPSAVYHCGGIADDARTWAEPERALRVNAVGTLYILDAIDRAGLDCPVLITGSALVYKPSPEPLSEESPVGPSSPYGLSKLAQEMVAARSELPRVIVTRAFNHAGPRQSEAYVTSSFARQIAEAEAGLREPVLRVGNLESRRDITDVRDTVKAYRLLVECGQSRRPYNVCSGRAYLIGELLQSLVAMARVDVRVESDPERMRPSDNPVVLGDPSRLRDETGWKPQIPIDRTLGDLLQYWRSRIAAP